MSMPVEIPPRLSTAVGVAMDRIADSGDHWTGAERLSIAAVTRAAFAQRHTAPWLRTGIPSPQNLGPEVVSLVTTLAADARRIDREWAETAISQVGERPYVELVALVATMAIIDAFAEAIGLAPIALPGSGSDAEPVEIALDYEVGDIGGYVAMRTPWTDANVGRALTASPSGNSLYRDLAAACYHDGQFYDLEWDRPLSRPQTEVLATAVSAANECFY